MSSTSREVEPRAGGVGSWRRQRRLALVTLVAALLLGLALPALVQTANVVRVAGFPLGFYLAAQGVPAALAILVLLWARRANRLDRVPPSGGDRSHS